MNAVDIITKKRDGQALSPAEIRYFINEFAQDSIPDYQAAAWAMAVYLNGMSREETVELTLAMAESGDVLSYKGILDFALDKHSSGGIGDKTTLVVLPLVVACGVPVAKMSGRGLSITGGTLDKMESISGYNVNLTQKQFFNQVQEIGIVLAGQTGDLAPADGKLYALRDVTGTVPSKPLIASSIMSKKIAGGADGIVLDVKAGMGAFMQTVDDARDLAQIMVDIGAGAGKKVTALISDMNQPLGFAIGNSLEVIEAIETLHGGGPEDFVEHCLVIAGHMLRIAGKSQAKDLSDIRQVVKDKLRNGEAWEVFRRLVAAQGGNLSEIDNPANLPAAPVQLQVDSPLQGYLGDINARAIGEAVLHLGAGRLAKGAPIDHSVGVVIRHKVGDFVEKGDPLFTIHAKTEKDADDTKSRLLGAYLFAEQRGLPLFYDVLFSE